MVSVVVKLERGESGKPLGKIVEPQPLGIVEKSFLTKDAPSVYWEVEDDQMTRV